MIKNQFAVSKPGRTWMLFALLGILVLAMSCGYRLRGSKGNLPEGIRSLGIPTFRNLTNQYKVEQRITAAVLKEFALRTNIAVHPSDTGVESVLVGEIRHLSSTPVTFGTQTVGSQTFGSTFMVTVEISAKLIRSRDSAVIWKNDKFAFREQHVLNANIKDFFAEENPALDRLARNFAESLASTILDR